MSRSPITIRREDSPLGEWTYADWRPAYLAGVVDVIWYFAGPTAHRRKRILPSGRVELLVNFGEPYRVVEGKGAEVLRAAWVGGILWRPQVVEQPARQTVLGVRLRPAAAAAVLATPMREVGGLAVELHDLVGQAAGELAERCHEADTVEGRIRSAGRWVAERLSRSRGVDAPIGWSADRIDRELGRVSIRALRERTGLSKSRFVADFREQIGVAPKLYARLIRFGRAASLLQSESASLVDAALASGYYDQPHMNADFRELAGLSPREFLASRHPVGDGTTAADLSSLAGSGPSAFRGDESAAPHAPAA